jgi:hypothetical protein
VLTSESVPSAGRLSVFLDFLFHMTGYQALEGTLAVWARGGVGVNPIASFEPAERSAGLPLDPRRRIVLPKDEVMRTSRLGERLAGMRERFPDLAWRTRTITCLGRRSGRWLTELVGPGTDTLLVAGDAELRPIRQGVTAIQLHRTQRTGRLRLEHLAGLQHDLFIAEQRRMVTRLVIEHVLSRFSDQPYPPRVFLTR